MSDMSVDKYLTFVGGLIKAAYDAGKKEEVLRLLIVVRDTLNHQIEQIEKGE